MISKYMSTACQFHGILRVGLFIISMNYVFIVYSIGIYWGLLIEFSYNFYKDLCDIRLLSILLTVLVSSCHDT